MSSVRWQSRYQVRRRTAPRLRRALALALGTLILLGLGLQTPTLLGRVRQHPYFRVAALELEGNRRLSRTQLLEWIGWQENVSVWDVDPEALRQRLVAHPWVRGATVQRTLPRRVRIQVRERRPVALVQLGGNFQYIDRLGKVLGPLLPGEVPDLPVISGIDEFADRELSSVHVHRALQLLRVCERLHCFDSISQIQIGHRGLTIVPVRPKVTLVLGWKGFEEKLKRSARVFAFLEGRAHELLVVDLSFSNLAVLKLAPEKGKPSPRARQSSGRTEA